MVFIPLSIQYIYCKFNKEQRKKAGLFRRKKVSNTTNTPYYCTILVESQKFPPEEAGPAVFVVYYFLWQRVCSVPVQNVQVLLCNIEIRTRGQQGRNDPGTSARSYRRSRDLIYHVERGVEYWLLEGTRGLPLSPVLNQSAEYLHCSNIKQQQRQRPVTTLLPLSYWSGRTGLRERESKQLVSNNARVNTTIRSNSFITHHVFLLECNLLPAEFFLQTGCKQALSPQTDGRYRGLPSRKCIMLWHFQYAITTSYQ